MPQPSDKHFTFTPQASTAAFDVVEFCLHEGLSQPFSLELKLCSHDPDIDFTGLLDNYALFTVWQGETAIRHVHGVISLIALGQSGVSRTRYEVLLEPDLALLALSSNWRIFRHLSAPQIIDKVLGEHHLINRDQMITAVHEPREFCVQAGETDLDFLARLAAEEGLLYTFEHTEKGHRLIYTDCVSCLGQMDESAACAVLYEGLSGGDPPQPAITRFNYTEQVRTAQQVQRDYTFVQPRDRQQHIVHGRDLQRQAGHYQRYDYPGRYKQEAVGKAFTETRLLALRNDARTAEAIGDDCRLHPGREFQLQGHPREALNTGWRPVSILHTGMQEAFLEEDSGDSVPGARYLQIAQLIDGGLLWKADLLPKPRIDGSHTATVTGPPGEEIYCDEWGRVKVSFPWDRESEQDDKSSCWILVSQGWAGTGWGSMAIPRVGQEVIVGFHDGDPDQPIILGRTYRIDNCPPYDLPKHKTRMTLKSKSHKGTGYNELRFEDALGNEEVFIHAEKDQNNVVKHDQSSDIGHDRRETVGNDESVRIGSHQTIAVGGNSLQQITGQQRVTVGQGIEVATTTYQLQLSERWVIQGPGGSITLDERGIHLEGVAINVDGPLRVTGKGTGNDPSLQPLADSTHDSR